MDQYGKVCHHIENVPYTPYNRSLLQVVFTFYCLSQIQIFEEVAHEHVTWHSEELQMFGIAGFL